MILLPRLCFTKLKVTGSQKELESFRYSVEGWLGLLTRDEYSDFSFQRICPIPENIYKHRSQTILEKWRESYWGTTSESAGATLRVLKDELHYFILSAETPPTKVIEALKGRFSGHLEISCSYTNERTGLSGQF